MSSSCASVENMFIVNTVHYNFFYLEESFKTNKTQTNKPQTKNNPTQAVKRLCGFQ